MNKEKTVWFIRHAQSLANADKNYKADKFFGSAVPLSKLGLEQAEDIAGCFILASDLIVTSPCIRSKQTANPLIKKYSNIPQEEWLIHEFNFIPQIKSIGITVNEFRPFIDEYWQKNNPKYIAGEGNESFIDVMNRARDTIEKIKNRKEKFIVFFSHEIFILAIKYILEKNPNKITSKEMRKFRKYFLSNRIPNAGKIELNFNSRKSV